ncbi:MAG: NAD(+)/NADH kinase [Oligoflexales bacterium]
MGLKVLLTQKSTGLDRRGEYVRKCVQSGGLNAANLESLQRSHDEHVETFSELQALLHEAGVHVVRVGGGRYWPDSSEFDAVIAVGGDGTVLESSHHIDQSMTPLIGVRSSAGSVGYLCAYSGKKELPLMIRDLEAKSFSTVLVARMQAHVFHVDKQHRVTTSPTLNDFLFCNANPAATSRYRMKVGVEEESHKSSGVWLAGPAGSTAAIHAAGGTPVTLDSGKFQYRVRELIQSTSRDLKLGSGFFDPEQIMIQNECSKAVLVPDGVIEPIKLRFGDQIQFELAESLKLVVS